MPRPLTRSLERSYARDLWEAGKRAKGFIEDEVLGELHRLETIARAAAAASPEARPLLASVIAAQVEQLVGRAEQRHAEQLQASAERIAVRGLTRVVKSQDKTHRRQMQALTEGLDFFELQALMIRAPRPTEDAVQLGDAEFKLKSGEVEHPANRPWGSADLETNPLKSPGLRAAMDDAVRENVDLIKRLPERVYRDLRRKLAAAVGRGLQVTQLQEVVRAELKSANPRSAMAAMMRRARLIARDQVGKFHGKLDETRQQESGVTHYRWRTVRDERVRGGPKYPHAHPDHAHREGQIFAWDKPPHEDDTDGHPGRPIQCRCYAEPVLRAPGAVYESGPRGEYRPTERSIRHLSEDPSTVELARALSRLSLVDGQLDEAEAGDVRRGLRAYLANRGLTSRVTLYERPSGNHLQIDAEMTNAAQHDLETGLTEISTQSYTNLSSESAQEQAQSVGDLIHEEGHGSGPCGLRWNAEDGVWENAYRGAGAVIEEGTNELLAHQWTTADFGPSIRVYEEYITPMQASLVEAGLTSEDTPADDLMSRASLIYRQGTDVIYSEEASITRWQSAVEDAYGEPLTDEQRNILRRAVEGAVPQAQEEDQVIDDESQSAKERALEKEKSRVLRLKAIGKLHVMHLREGAMIYGRAFNAWVKSEGIEPDITLAHNELLR